MLLVDTKEKKIIQDVELKMLISKSRPHSMWLKEQVTSLIMRSVYTPNLFGVIDKLKITLSLFNLFIF